MGGGKPAHSDIQKKLSYMVKAFIATAALAMTTTALMAGTQTANIGKTDAKTLGTELMTPEALWAMGRISAAVEKKQKELQSLQKQTKEQRTAAPLRRLISGGRRPIPAFSAIQR